MLESGLDDSHLFKLNLHLQYIKRTLFDYNTSRLPHQISLLILSQNISWLATLNSIGQEFSIQWGPGMTIWQWNQHQSRIQDCLKGKYYQNRLDRIQSSESFYRNLDPAVSDLYFHRNNSQYNIQWIFKARCDLNGSRFSRRVQKQCSLCNTKEIENIQHFIGRCPILNTFRLNWLNKRTISEEELIIILNGDGNWQGLIQYIVNALAYRKTLILEYNN